MGKKYVTIEEFRKTCASVTEHWIESRLAENPSHCCTMGAGRNCKIILEADFFISLIDAECAAHGVKIAAAKRIFQGEMKKEAS